MTQAPRYTVDFHPETGKATVSGLDPVTRKPWAVTVKADDLVAWESGLSTQRAFPYLTADEREMLQSGLTPEGWAASMPRDVEE